MCAHIATFWLWFFEWIWRRLSTTGQPRAQIEHRHTNGTCAINWQNDGQKTIVKAKLRSVLLFLFFFHVAFVAGENTRDHGKFMFATFHVFVCVFIWLYTRRWSWNDKIRVFHRVLCRSPSNAQQQSLCAPRNAFPAPTAKHSTPYHEFDVTSIYFVCADTIQHLTWAQVCSAKMKWGKKNGKQKKKQQPKQECFVFVTLRIFFFLSWYVWIMDALHRNRCCQWRARLYALHPPFDTLRYSSECRICTKISSRRWYLMLVTHSRDDVPFFIIFIPSCWCWWCCCCFCCLLSSERIVLPKVLDSLTDGRTGSAFSAPFVVQFYQTLSATTLLCREWKPKERRCWAYLNGGVSIPFAYQQRINNKSRNELHASGKSGVAERFCCTFAKIKSIRAVAWLEHFFFFLPPQFLHE